MATTYLPVHEALGHVPLGRACRFQALLKEIRLSAAPPAPEPEPEPVLRPVTAAEQAGPTGPDAAAGGFDVRRAFEETVLPLHLAIVEQGRYVDVACLVCVAQDGDRVRAVSPEEAISDDFPAEVYADAFASFLKATSALTMSHCGFARDSNSP